MPVSRANGLAINYEKAGDGPPLVLIHALPFDLNLWQFQVERLSSRFTTIAMDLRGWGFSDKPTTPFTLRDMADDVMGILRDENIAGGALVMGCSIGSKIALMLACDHPTMFRGTILIGGHSAAQQQFAHRIADYRAHAEAGTLAGYHRGHLRYGVTQGFADSITGRYLIEGFVERGHGLNADCIAHVFEANTVADLTDKLPAYRTPTLIVNGEHDNALAGGTRTASLIAGSEHFILPGAGHCCFLEDPATFNGRVADFLARNNLWPAGR